MATSWGAGDVPKGRCPMKDFEEFRKIVLSDENRETEDDILKEAFEKAYEVEPTIGMGFIGAVLARYANAVSLNRIRLYHEWMTSPEE